MTLNAKDFILICVIGMVFSYLVSDFVTSSNSADLVKGCGRQNDRTVGQYEKYLADEKESRLFSEQATDPRQKQITWKAAEEYEEAARTLIDSVKDDGLQLEQGSPATDCEAAYEDPLPGPFDLVQR